VLSACGDTGSAPARPSCRSLAQSQRPNVVLVTLCSLRFDHTGLGGYDRPTTPFLDALAASGVLFASAVSAASWTKPATASLLTGLTPNVHALWDFHRLADVVEGRVTPKRVLADGLVTLPECLAEAGWATACRVNNVNAGAFFNLTQGCADTRTDHGMDTAAMLDDLGAWLARRDRARPFFFLLFTRDAHTPYGPSWASYRRFSADPVPEDRYDAHRKAVDTEVRRLVEARAPVPAPLAREWTALYDAALAELDGALARLPRVLAEAGVTSDTVVIVTADHGERFFEHGLVGHGGRLDEPVLRVPLIVAGPGVPPGRRVDRVVRTIDVYPTVAELAGVEPPAMLQGRSLVPLLAGRDDGFPPLTAFSTTGRAHALRDGHLKLHARPAGRALYDVAEDPEEQHDVAAERPATLRTMTEALGAWLRQEETLRARVGEAPAQEPTPEVVEQLRALGYL
jgi:arylsulfatase A-like enzyme